ncbi:PE-PGRS family protein [Spirosoma sp. SC4-14]|uniref:PE-PGRS family protein n=1 Tax=Spirosoma sp. SC4-14 TaxID=3128900 RepID=UPI0030D15009
MRAFPLILCLLITASCKLTIPDTDKTLFSSIPDTTQIQTNRINYVTGMADSRSQTNNFWLIQGEGTSNKLTMLGHNGLIKGELTIPRFPNRDWEDLAIGPGPESGTTYLYIGDIGDSTYSNDYYQIYRLPEPASVNSSITQIERINFTYPDGAQTAKAMLVDPETKDIFIIVNRNPNVKLYRLPYPQDINTITVAEAFGELPIGMDVTGASISTDGQEVVVRNYTQAFYWKRSGHQTLDDLLRHTVFRMAPLASEPKGETICFDQANRGYYTLSQKSMASSSVNLYYFAKQ